MARAPRLDLPGFRHHVMNRGARREAVFLDDACCLRFLDLASQLPARHGVGVHGYAVMPNHFHLMLSCPEGRMGRAMQFLLGSYARWLNQQHAWDGPVWRGRYASRLVTRDDHWRHLLAYCHLNPVKAGLARRPGDATWTSHAAFVGEIRTPAWLSLDDLRALYGTTEAYLTYLDDLRLGREVGPPDLDPEIEWRPRTGDVRPAVPPAPRRPWPLDWDAAWAAVEAVTGVDRAGLLAAARGPAGNPARWVALWWLPRATGLSQGAVARRVGVDPALVSRAASRVRDAAREGPPLEAWVAALAATLPSGRLDP